METLLDGARRFAADVERKGTEPGFVAHASKWLNEQRWENEYAREWTAQDQAWIKEMS